MELILHKIFKRNFKKLPSKVQNKFFEKIEIFKNDKFHIILNNHSVEKIFPGCRSINITGDYRAIFEDFGDTIIFLHIGTHSELYK